MKMFKLVWQYFVKNICVFLQYTYMKMFCLETKCSNHDGYLLLFYKVYFSRKWEQILGLFSFLLKMPKSHRFYSWTQVVTFSCEMGSRMKYLLWLSHLHVKEEGTVTHESAGETVGNSLPVIYLIFLAGSTFSGPFPFFCSRMSVRCTATVLFTWP